MGNLRAYKIVLTGLAALGAAALLLVVSLVAQSEEPAAVMPPVAPAAAPCSPQVDIAATFLGGAREDPDVRRVDTEIERTFAAALSTWQTSPPKSLAQRLELLGKLALYDKTLSVNSNQACTSCHVPETGFTGGVELYNRTIVAQPGSVPIRNARPGKPSWRIASRKPQSYSYAPFAPLLHYNASQQDLVGGNFWDMRASGLREGNPAATQAEGPFVNLLEMGFADPACVIYRLSQGRYRAFFEQVWGRRSFAIAWPANIGRVCSTPAAAPPGPRPAVELSAADRFTVTQSYDHLAQAIAVYEAGPEVSPFSSKLDDALAHPKREVLSKEELAGWALFRGKGKCNSCHLDGTSRGNSKLALRDLGDKAPLFTDFASANLGVPKNLALPFYCEDQPDQHGYTANREGLAFVDRGVGAFLSSANNPNADWARLAPAFVGRFQTPTVRNVDKRPRPDFVKAYAHNGYFKSLKEIVHFYNTRDKLPRCAQGARGEKVSCWPAPEISANLDRTIGNLGLTSTEEDQLVAFLRALTDGHLSPGGH